MKAEDIDQDGHIGTELEQGNANEPPAVVTHQVDPNVVEILQEEEDEEEEPGHPLDPNPTMEPEVQTESLEPIVEVEEDEDEIETIVPPQPPTRRSSRVTAGQSSKYEPYAMLTRGYGLACSNLKVKVALERFGKSAYDSIKDELEQLFIKKRALRPMLLREVSRANLYFPVLRSHMFLREKYNAMGYFEKIKARLVADGSTQDREDFDDEEISSPTASLESIFNMLKIIAVEKRHLLILDVGGAYLNAKIDTPAYMFIQPDLVNILLNICPQYRNFRDEKGRILVEIEKAMYGLVQSARLWYNTITGVLEKNGFTPNPMDPCVWNKTINGNQTSIVIYVDDLAISSKSKADVHSTMELIRKEFIDIKIKESSEMSYLGMNLKVTDDGINVDMINYIEEMLKEFEGVYEYTHPADDKLFNNEGTHGPSKDAKKFHKVVAKLLFLCKRGRPDIALPVHYLCTRVKNPTEMDDQKLARVMGFMKGTLREVRKISAKPFTRVEAYIDAAHAAHEDGYGHSGGVIMVGGTAVECITRKQKCVARDSAEAEMVALEGLVLDVEWHNEWYKGQGYKMDLPLIFRYIRNGAQLGSLDLRLELGKVQPEYVRGCQL